MTTTKSGFIVHPTMGFLGASPDARVTYSKREVSLLEAYSYNKFYCHYKDGSFCLDDTHEYYHQATIICWHGSISLVLLLCFHIKRY